MESYTWEREQQNCGIRSPWLGSDSMRSQETENKDQLPAWPPRVQVAGVSSLEEALFCQGCGVDSLGFTLGLPWGPHDGLDSSKTRHIADNLPPDITKVLITYIDQAREASELARRVLADAVQFHGGISDSELRIFRQAQPYIKTIGCVTVAGLDAVHQAASFRMPPWDAIILDSLDPSTGRKGATGLTHDWAISARIVEECMVPVILAGGLTPENVREAITKVRPAGVDVHTGVENPDGSRNFNRIRAFAKTALETFHRLNYGRCR
ncbi:phosphoribosylanthranilate isomerase [Thermodesulfobacteriota bacterium]